MFMILNIDSGMNKKILKPLKSNAANDIYLYF